MTTWFAPQGGGKRRADDVYSDGEELFTIGASSPDQAMVDFTRYVPGQCRNLSVLFCNHDQIAPPPDECEWSGQVPI